MEHWKPEQVRRIWQRVQNHDGKPPIMQPFSADNTGNVCKGIWEIYSGEMRDSALLLRIAQAYFGQNRMLLRRIAAEDRSHGAYLKKICTMKEQKAAASVIHPIEKGQPAVLLQRCYGRKMQRLSQYESRISDPKLGHIFQKLAQQEQTHCRILRSILEKT